jgi:hypothetical protein
MVSFSYEFTYTALLARTAARSLAATVSRFTRPFGIDGGISRASWLLPTLARSALRLLTASPFVSLAFARLPLLGACAVRLTCMLGIVSNVAGASALIVFTTLIARHNPNSSLKRRVDRWKLRTF